MVDVSTYQEQGPHETGSAPLCWGLLGAPRGTCFCMWACLRQVLVPPTAVTQCQVWGQGGCYRVADTYAQIIPGLFEVPFL